MAVLVTLVVTRSGIWCESTPGLEFVQGVSCVREVRSWWIGLIFLVCDTAVVMGHPVYV